MRKTLVLLAGLVVLVVANFGIARREQLLHEGRAVLLELAPVDPRSLMQGDYMALRFAVARAVRGETQRDGHLVLALDAHGVGRYRRLDDGRPLAADEQRLRYRVRNGQIRLVTDAYFFQEGEGARYATARYGEVRVAADGEALLTGLRDADLRPLAP